MPVGPKGSQSHRTAFLLSGAFWFVAARLTVVPLALPACYGVAEHDCVSASSYESRMKCGRQVVPVRTRASAQRRECGHGCETCRFAQKRVSSKLFRA